MNPESNEQQTTVETKAAEQISTTPTTETKVETKVEAPEITADAFNQFIKTPFTEQEEVETEVKPVETKEAVKPAATEEKTEQKETTAVETKPTTDTTTTQQQQQTTQQTDGRDYSDLPEEVVPHFKKMGGKAFDYFKPLFKQHKELEQKHKEQEAEIVELRKGRPPESYHEHPRAFMLTPEFESAAINRTKAMAVAEHWEAQAKAIAGGSDTYTEIFFDENGNIRESAPLKVTTQTEREVSGYVHGAQRQLMDQETKLRVIGANYQQSYQQAVQAIKEFEDSSFKIFTGENAAKLAPAVKDTIKAILPPAFHSNPLASGYSKAIMTIRIMGQELMKLKNEAATKAGQSTTQAGQSAATTQQQTTKAPDGKVTNPDDVKRGGPTNANMQGAGASGNNGNSGEVSFDQFAQFSRRRY